MKRSTNARVVMVTCGSLAELRRIAKAVVGQRLAARVNVISAPVESVYRWKGRVESVTEFLLVIKTTTRRLKELAREIARWRSYEVREFLVIALKGGSKE